MRKTSRSHHSTLNELNITPLLDLAFVLLVIFIITTPQLTNNLELNLPSAKPPVPKPDAPNPKLARIAVDEQGRAWLNDEALSLSVLTERLRSLKAADTEIGVVVKGADNVEYQNMINVLDILRQLDISKVGLATD